MTALPASSDFTGLTRTEAQARTYQDDLRSFLAERMGAAATALPSGATGSYFNVDGAKVVHSDGANALSVAVNWYNDGANKFIANGYASRLRQEDGAFVFETTANNASGAGAALTWLTRATFSQAGDLILNNNFAGTQSFLAAESGNSKFGMQGQSFEGRYFWPSNSVATFGTIDVSDGTTYSEKARIDTSGFLNMSGGGSIVLENLAALNGKNSGGTAGNLISRGASDVTYIGDTTFGNELRIQNGGVVTVHAGGASEKLRVQSGGNVSIGATTDNASLSIFKQTTELSGTGNGFGVHIYPAGTGACYVDAVTSSTANTILRMRSYNNGTYHMMQLNQSGHFMPGADNSQDCGGASNRWGTVYAGTGTINTSFYDYKTEIRSLQDAEKACALELKQHIKIFKFKDAVAEKGDAARYHVGVIANNNSEVESVQSIFEKHGLDPHKYGVFCFDEWTDVYEKRQTNEGAKTTVSKTVNVQATKSVEVKRDCVKLIAGAYTKTTETVTEIVPLFDTVDLYDEKGNLIGEHKIPRMVDKVVTEEVDAEPIFEDVLIKPAGHVYSVRYDELAMFILGAL